jgi:hypothetical protein
LGFRVWDKEGRVQSEVERMRSPKGNCILHPSPLTPHPSDPLPGIKKVC